MSVPVISVPSPLPSLKKAVQFGLFSEPWRHVKYFVFSNFFFLVKIDTERNDRLHLQSQARNCILLGKSGHPKS